MTAPKPKIFIFVNAGQGTDWQSGMAMAEDGVVLARHVSSSRPFFEMDMGLTSTRKHDRYAAHYAEGYELVDVPDDEVPTHPGLHAAYLRNQELARVAKDPAP